MKLSIAWIFDHIRANWKDLDLKDVVNRFNRVTAEIEHFEKIEINLDVLYASKIIQENGKISIQNCHNKKIYNLKDLPDRADLKPNDIYLIKEEKGKISWTTLKDLNSSKEGLLPKLWIDAKDLFGNWRNQIDKFDYIITVDNKSITNRPDMWGHRGFAREIAAIFNLPFLSEDQFINNLPIKHYEKNFQATSDYPLTLEIKEDDVCKRLSGIVIEEVENHPSSIFMAHRLCKVDSRPINAIIDATNYVMLDWSQPLHAFDAKKVNKNTLIARFAKNGEKLKLLDEQEITLTDKDLVIADSKPISLAGIMGGSETAVTDQTNSLIIESANFDPNIIRLSSLRHKKRTESSARFEKSLDLNQNTQGILRFLRILDDLGLKYKSEDSIISLGKLAQDVLINIDHDVIIKKLGMNITSDQIVKILTKLEFGVKVTGNTYQVTVPTFRSSKDITIAEDIVEEIARFFGYDNILPQFATRYMTPFSILKVDNTREIKNYFAYSMKMHELYNYAFYDQSFLNELHYDVKDSVKLANPISENWIQLATSLIPHLIKAIVSNEQKEKQLRFFEIAKIWDNKDTLIEISSIAGIIASRKQEINFYDAKYELQQLFKILNLNIEWKKPKKELTSEYPWIDPYESAEIESHGTVIGYVTKIKKLFLNKVFDGDAFVFELNGDIILNHKPLDIQYQPISKYPEVELDISMLIAQNVNVAQIENAIKSADERIKLVNLIDHFYKDEWKGQKSLTFRFVISDNTKTLSKDEIDEINDNVIYEVQQLGAAIR
ncbi:phenylalanine--tRNA ligase subunit beta [Candidatus Dependentiae bacterium]|nr:phenylalanine--tRNA ligase subunit beta [Candidatus Dependentiae bacterium]